MNNQGLQYCIIQSNSRVILLFTFISYDAVKPREQSWLLLWVYELYPYLKKKSLLTSSTFHDTAKSVAGYSKKVHVDIWDFPTSASVSLAALWPQCFPQSCMVGRCYVICKKPVNKVNCGSLLRWNEHPIMPTKRIYPSPRSPKSS